MAVSLLTGVAAKEQTPRAAPDAGALLAVVLRVARRKQWWLILPGRVDASPYSACFRFPGKERKVIGMFHVFKPN